MFLHKRWRVVPACPRRLRRTEFACITNSAKEARSTALPYNQFLDVDENILVPLRLTTASSGIWVSVWKINPHERSLRFSAASITSSTVPISPVRAIHPSPGYTLFLPPEGPRRREIHRVITALLMSGKFTRNGSLVSGNTRRADGIREKRHVESFFHRVPSGGLAAQAGAHSAITRGYSPSAAGVQRSVWKTQPMRQETSFCAAATGMKVRAPTARQKHLLLQTSLLMPLLRCRRSSA